jgi:hypothetical protein
MTGSVRYDRLILSLDDKDLENFVRAWAESKQGYFRVKVFAGVGDRGRDVVGHLTEKLDEGEWHNYQCKQYGKTLPTANGIAELGKVLYYSFLKEFTAPTKFYFVAPRGLNRNLRTLVNNPAAFKATLIKEWAICCGGKIIENQMIAMTEDLRKFIDAWNFSNVEYISLNEMLKDAAAMGVLLKWFGKDPGPAPDGSVPVDIQIGELPYVSQLVDAYGERDVCVYDSHDKIINHAKHGPHLSTQRERFYDADAFARFYRDNTMVDEIRALRREVLFGIIDEHRADHSDSLSRVDAVMKQAAVIHPSGVLGRHAKIPVKQGLCHHFEPPRVFRRLFRLSHAAIAGWSSVA